MHVQSAGSRERAGAGEAGGWLLEEPSTQLPFPARAQMLHLTSSSLCALSCLEICFLLVVVCFFFFSSSLLISSQLGSYKPVSSKWKPEWKQRWELTSAGGRGEQGGRWLR